MNTWLPIPGETPIAPSRLKDRTIKTPSELNKAEARNILRPHIKYLAGVPTKRIAPFDYSWVLRLHEEMYCEVWLFAGQTRQINLNIGVDWQFVSDQVLELTRDLPCWVQGSMPILEQAMMLHYRAVWIHPFENGNGRWARLLANIWLKLHKMPVVIWPEEDIKEQTSSIRDEYIRALYEADRGDFGPLLELHKQHLSK